jgi:hypothetical protein
MAAKPPQSLAAYELVFCGVAALRGENHYKPEDAIPFLELAIEKNPSHGVAYGFLALARIMIAGYGQARAFWKSLSQPRRGCAQPIHGDFELGFTRRKLHPAAGEKSVRLNV